MKEAHAHQERECWGVINFERMPKPILVAVHPLIIM